MIRHLKSSLLILFGIGWIAIALAVALFAFLYVRDGAGAQFFGFLPFSSSTIVIGFVQFLGLIFGAFLCLLIGIWLCLYDLLPPLRKTNRPTVASELILAYCLFCNEGSLGTARMKNIQVIDGAENCVYDIFAATGKEFAAIFPLHQDVAFIEEVSSRVGRSSLEKTFAKIWTRRLRKDEVRGIHGTLFYHLERKKIYYPTRRDEEASNPGGSRLR